MIAVDWTKVHPTFDFISDSVAVRLCESIHCEVFHTHLITISGFSRNGLFNYKLQLNDSGRLCCIYSPDNQVRPPLTPLQDLSFDSPQPIRMHTAQGPSHSMFTAHNITVNNGVFNQYIAGEQRGEITIKFKFSVFD